ncbi:hypothetical protein [Nocardia sp. NPDC057227]|uniref:hypothetical protein n=1 Tax=Nocardia sp. NPDC057227 TaxID=3346056 RepID=UPI0036260F9D
MNTRPTCADALPLMGKGNSRATLVVVLMAGIAVLLAACGGREPDSSAPGAASRATSTTRQLEAVPAPDPVTPDGVAVAALREIYTWNPAAEAPGDSLARARKLLGPSLIRTADAPAADAPKPTLQWGEWAAAGATVRAFTFASGERPPAAADPNVQQFKIGIEQTVEYRNGRQEQLPPATVIATVVRTADGWRLDGFR